ncbi:MAG: PqqD family peptide modification chaperone [Candidatus Binataceae bacterium]
MESRRADRLASARTNSIDGLTVTREGIVCAASHDEMRRARAQFDRCHYLRLPGLIEPHLLRVMERHLARESFAYNSTRVGSDLVPAKGWVGVALHVPLNDPQLFRPVRQLTGCGPIGCFGGRLYRLAARPGMELRWHNDLRDTRLVALTINLSPQPYRGEMLQLRAVNQRGYEEIPNLDFGDAVLFRVSPRLKHRVTPIEGRIAKTAFAGWFAAKPGYRAVRKKFFDPAKLGNEARAGRNGEWLPLPGRSDAMQIPDDVVFQKSPDETFVMSFATSAAYGLDAVGGRIWELLGAGLDLGAVADALASEYEAAPARVELDVRRLVGELAARRLIRVARRKRT